MVAPASRLGDSANCTNLNTFSSRGGKLIIYHGVSDPRFIYLSRQKSINLSTLLALSSILWEIGCGPAASDSANQLDCGNYSALDQRYDCAPVCKRNRL
jgi:hypothetical protein